jgi:hypothetical protein
MLPEVEKKVEPIFKKWKEDRIKEGYPEPFVEKALERTRGWIEGFSKLVDSRFPDLVARVQEELVPEALEHSERWLRGLRGMIISAKSEKLSEVV